MNNDKIQLTVRDEIVLVSSEIIAQDIGVFHASFYKLIKRYSTELEELGILRFEIRTKTNVVGARNEMFFYYLNKNQARLALALARNSAKVVEYKVKLIKQMEEEERTILNLYEEVNKLRGDNQRASVNDDEFVEMSIELKELKEQIASKRGIQLYLGVHSSKELPPRPQTVREYADEFGFNFNDGDFMKIAKIAANAYLTIHGKMPEYSKDKNKRCYEYDDTSVIEYAITLYQRKRKR
jgi:phage regulator Rha-like protein